MPPLATTPHATFWTLMLAILLCATLASMFSAWTWAIVEFSSGRPLLPEPKPRVVPWGTGSVVLVFLLWLSIQFGVSIAYLAYSGSVKNHRAPTAVEQMVVVSVINVALLVLIPALLRLSASATFSDLGLERKGMGRKAWVGVMGFLLIAPVIYALNGLAVLVFKQNKHPLEQMVAARPTAGVALLAFFAAVVLAPAAEELIFRGIMQSWLTQLFRRQDFDDALDLADGLDPIPAEAAVATSTETGVSAPVPGEAISTGDVRPVDLAWGEGDAPRLTKGRTTLAPIVLTSAVFAAVHLPQWPAPLAIFFLSVALGVVYQRSGSLIASFMMHALFNGFGTMMLFLAILSGQLTNPKAVPTATCLTVAEGCAKAGHPPMMGQPIGGPGIGNSRRFFDWRGAVARLNYLRIHD